MIYRTLGELHEAIGDLMDRHGRDTPVGTLSVGPMEGAPDGICSVGVGAKLAWGWEWGSSFLVVVPLSGLPGHEPDSDERKVVILQ